MKDRHELTLSENQTKAFMFFNEHGYVVVEAPRRSGKTTLLKTIIDSNTDKKIGVYCLSYMMFQNLYKNYPNVTWLEYPGREDDSYFDIIIGDEVLIEPRKDQMTACAYSKKYISLRWGNDFIDEKDMDRIKKELSPEHFEVEFGQYKK